MRRALIAAAVAIAIIVIAIIALTQYRQPEYSRPLVPKSLEDLISGASPSLEVSSSFRNWSNIPRIYTCDGADTSPPIEVSNIPASAKCLALIMYDPDAPRGTFYHWLLYNISIRASSIRIPPDMPKEYSTPYGLQGVNDFGAVGYGGPCPPHGSKHRYVILVLALSECPRLPPGLNAASLINSLRGKVISYGLIVGTYGR